MNRAKNSVATPSQRLLTLTVVLAFTVICTGCHEQVEPLPFASDTTSHNFEWQTETIGDGTSSLCDVAVINDSLAYAVGIIYMRDSSGSLHFPAYNLARWNGKQWDMMLVDPVYGYTPCYSIVAFGPDDIWVGGSSPAHWDGKRWSVQGLQGEYPGRFQIGAIGGTGSKDLYCAGVGGALVHYDGSTWRSIESGTTAQIKDIWGGSNSVLGDGVVLMTASDKFAAGDRKVLRARKGMILDTIQWAPADSRPISSIWFSTNSKVYLCGTGVYSFDGQSWTRIPDLPTIYTNRIRGNSPNDLLAVGDFGVVLHFNGSSWIDYPELIFASGQYSSISIKRNTAIAVGVLSSSQRAAILIGRRR